MTMSLIHDQTSVTLISTSRLALTIRTDVTKIFSSHLRILSNAFLDKAIVFFALQYMQVFVFRLEEKYLTR